MDQRFHIQSWKTFPNKSYSEKSDISVILTILNSDMHTNANTNVFVKAEYKKNYAKELGENKYFTLFDSYITPCKFLIPALADGPSLESEW